MWLFILFYFYLHFSLYSYIHWNFFCVLLFGTVQSVRSGQIEINLKVKHKTMNRSVSCVWREWVVQTNGGSSCTGESGLWSCGTEVRLNTHMNNISLFPVGRVGVLVPTVRKSTFVALNILQILHLSFMEVRRGQHK